MGLRRIYPLHFFYSLKLLICLNFYCPILRKGYIFREGYNPETIAETDTTGNYFGSIYLEQYLGDDIIFVQMPMGSGGIYGYWYNCDGTQIVFEDTTIFPKRDKLIYSIIEGNQNEFETQ